MFEWQRRMRGVKRGTGTTISLVLAGEQRGVLWRKDFLRIINLHGDALITHNVYPYGTIALGSNAEH